MKDADYYMSSLLYHLNPLCNEPGALICGTCDSDLELVPPEMLYHVCRICYPQSFDWKPYADTQSN